MVCIFQEAAEGSWGVVNSSEGPAHGCLQMDNEGMWTLKKLWWKLGGVVAEECQESMNLKCLVVWRNQNYFPEGLVTMCTTTDTLQANQDWGNGKGGDGSKSSSRWDSQKEEVFLGGKNRN